MKGKSVVVIDTPDMCSECPFRVKDELILIGDYTYKQLYRCRITPDEVYDNEDEEFDIYITPNSKPDWCPLKSDNN